jgi:hypothetical protein
MGFEIKKSSSKKSCVKNKSKKRKVYCIERMPYGAHHPVASLNINKAAGDKKSRVDRNCR